MTIRALPNQSPRRPAARRSFGPSLESLEVRALLSVGGTISPRASAVRAVASRDDQAYIATVIGEDSLGKPSRERLRQNLLADLARGVSREQVALELLRSPGARTVLVRSTYLRMLGRDPRAGELDRGVKLLGTRDSRALVASLAATPEYGRVRGGGTAAGFVDAIYRETLYREPTAAERDAGLAALGRRVGRRAFATSLIEGEEGRSTRVAAVLGRYGLAPEPLTLQKGAIALARPNGLYRVAARALASEPVYQRAVNPPNLGTPPVGDASSNPPGFPLAPGFDLASSVRGVAIAESTLFGASAASAGSDNILWIAGTFGVVTYDPSTGLTTPVNFSGVAASVAAINANEAYVVAGYAQEGDTTIVHVLKGVSTTLPALPGNDAPTQVSASPTDGTLWALGQSGQVYSYTQATQAWAVVPSGGYAISAISVGSASNIWALTTSGVPLQYASASGFQEVTGLGEKVQSVQATADGAVWIVAANFLFLRQPGGTFNLAPAQATGLTSLMLGAGTRDRAYQVGLMTINGTLTPTASLISVGILDRDAVPFPSYTGDDQAAYLALSVAAGVTDPGGIRTTYDSPGLPFSDFFSRIQAAVRPDSIPAPAWDAIQTELLNELEAVETIYGRFALMTSVITQIQVVNDGNLPAAASTVGLSNNTGSDSGDTIRLVLEGLFDAVLWGVAAVGLPPAGAVVASIIASGVGTAFSIYEASNPPGPDNAVAIEYGKLQSQMDTLFLNSISAINSDITTIVKDFGKLNTVSGAILGGQWPFLNQDATDIAAASSNAFNLFYFQSLAAAKWQVVTFPYGDYIDYPVTTILNVPAYDYFTVPDGYEDGMPVETVYFMNQIGSSTDLNGSYLGPYPDASMISTIAALPGVSMQDFWSGQNGWNLIKQVQATIG